MALVAGIMDIRNNVIQNIIVRLMLSNYGHRYLHNGGWREQTDFTAAGQFYADKNA